MSAHMQGALKRAHQQYIQTAASRAGVDEVSSKSQTMKYIALYRVFKPEVGWPQYLAAAGQVAQLGSCWAAACPPSSSSSSSSGGTAGADRAERERAIIANPASRQGEAVGKVARSKEKTRQDGAPRPNFI